MDKRVIIGNFKCQIFPVQYEFYIGSRYAILSKFVERNPRRELGEEYNNSEWKALCYPMYDVKPAKCAFLFVKEYFDYGTLAHETAHAVFLTMRFVRHISDGSTNETEAYYQGWLMERILLACDVKIARCINFNKVHNNLKPIK